MTYWLSSDLRCESDTYIYTYVCIYKYISTPKTPSLKKGTSKKLQVSVTQLVVCDISKKYQYPDNLSISLSYRFLYHFSRFRYYQTFSIIIKISKNISINQHHLVCDCTITLEMKVVVLYNPATLKTCLPVF